MAAAWERAPREDLWKERMSLSDKFCMAAATGLKLVAVGGAALMLTNKHLSVEGTLMLASCFALARTAEIWAKYNYSPKIKAASAAPGE